MKKILAGQVSAVMLVPALLALAQGKSVQAQSYIFSGSVTGQRGNGNGNQEIPFADVDNGPGNGNGSLYLGTSMTLAFGAINGTLVYDPVAATMQMIGSVSVAGSTQDGVFSTSFDDTQKVQGVEVSASVALNYTIANVNNGQLSFNTGPVAASFGRWTLPVQIPISGSYSLVTGGQTYTGVFSYSLYLNTILTAQNITSSTLTFSADTVPDSTFLDVPLAQTNAANGVQLNLQAKDPSDGTTYQSWHIDNSEAMVPEPSTWALMASGLAMFALCKRNRVKRSRAKA